MRGRILSVCVWLTGKMLLAQGMPDMPGMNMSPTNAAQTYLMNLASGTSANPENGALPMSMSSLGSWSTMFMGNAFIVDTQQSGPRGGDKLYSTNWAMGMAQHRIGKKGAFEVDAMLSLEPATITDRRYPLLFQTGETAFGKPIVDGQHPHNFVMGLGVHYTYQLAEKRILDIYVAPVGDPALGPVAYPHRASAEEIPQAPISHHWQDSTHISDDVITVGLSQGPLRIEASGFHGAEPGENRWTIQQGAIDSWSSRLWFTPSKNWSAQFSMGRLTHPEALEPGNQTRMTGSVSYSRDGWNSSLIWGRRNNLDSYLAETVVPLTAKNLITARVELVNNDELEPSGIPYRIGAYTIGYTREVPSIRHFSTGIGFNLTAYTLPNALKLVYGDHPVGGNIFIRIRFKG